MEGYMVRETAASVVHWARTAKFENQQTMTLSKLVNEKKSKLTPKYKRRRNSLTEGFAQLLPWAKLEGPLVVLPGVHHYKWEFCSMVAYPLSQCWNHPLSMALHWGCGELSTGHIRDPQGCCCDNIHNVVKAMGRKAEQRVPSFWWQLSFKFLQKIASTPITLEKSGNIANYHRAIPEQLRMMAGSVLSRGPDPECPSSWRPKVKWHLPRCRSHCTWISVIGHYLSCP